MSYPSTENVTSVFIVEDHELVRRMTSQLIQRIPSLSLCGEAASAEAALVQIPECQPQLVLVDVSLPGMSGIELIRILHEKYPDMLLLALSGHDERVYGVPAMLAGARGFVTKANVDEVQKAILQVARGEIYLSKRLRAILAGSF